MDRQKITMWVVAGVLLWGSVAEAGMTMGNWDRSAPSAMGPAFDAAPSIMHAWKSDLGKTYRPSGPLAPSTKSADFRYAGPLGGGSLQHRVVGLTDFGASTEIQSPTWNLHLDRSRFNFSRFSTCWDSPFDNGFWQTRCWDGHIWLRDWIKDKDDQTSCPPSVPSPGAIVLAGIGAASVGWLRRRRSL